MWSKYKTKEKFNCLPTSSTGDLMTWLHLLCVGVCVYSFEQPTYFCLLIEWQIKLKEDSAGIYTSKGSWVISSTANVWELFPVIFETINY